MGCRRHPSQGLAQFAAALWLLCQALVFGGFSQPWALSAAGCCDPWQVLAAVQGLGQFCQSRLFSLHLWASSHFVTVHGVGLAAQTAACPLSLVSWPWTNSNVTPLIHTTKPEHNLLPHAPVCHRQHPTGCGPRVTC